MLPPDDWAPDEPRGQHDSVAGVDLSPDGLEPDGPAVVRIDSVRYGPVKGRGDWIG